MKYDQYVSLIQDLEISAANNRRAYELKILLLIALGYGYFLGLLLLFFVPIPAVGFLLWQAPEQIGRLLLVGAKLWWVLVPGLAIYFGFIGSAVKAITAKLPDPVGVELKRSDAPELFDFVGRTCKELKAKRPAKVLVTDEYNAAVATMPRFGIFGQKVILLLGLPLMKALSPDQFKAVLAHEIGHISGKHGGFAKWAYQMREAWGRLIESQDENEHKFSALYKKFVEWFFPYFTAYSFVLMREHEKDADREAARLVGGQALGEALISIETKGARLQDDFWLKVHEENIASDKPSERIFTRMINSLAFVAPEQAAASLSKAVAVPTDHNDSHPSLADRLRLIGYWTSGDLPDLPPSVEADAATVFLGAASESLAAGFDAKWDEQAGETWKERYEHFQGAQKRIGELEEMRAKGNLSHEELRELAKLVTEKDGFKAAIPIIEEAVEKFPDEGVAWLNLGLASLFQENDDGLAHLEKAVALDKSLKYEADQLAFDYLRGKGRLDEAKRYASSLDEQAEEYEQAQKERQAPLPDDDFKEHDLSQEFIDSIPGKLAGLDEVTAIYAVNKVVKHFPEVPYRVLMIDVRPKGRFKNRDDADPSTVLDIVAKRLETGEISYFVLLINEWAGTKEFVTRIPGSRIYHRADKNPPTL